MMNRSISIFTFFILVGCGGAQAPGAVTHGHFSRIQVEEARIEEARVASRDGDCEDHCRALDEASDAERSICAIAEQTNDADVTSRCDRASENTARLASRECDCDQ